MAQDPSQASLKELVSSAVADLQRLVKAQVELAKWELQQTGQAAAKTSLLVLIALTMAGLGGIFLLVKGLQEIRELISGGHDEDPRTTKASSVFWVVIAQIAVIDIVFSLDSVITAVGIAEHIPIMVFAILLAVAIMLLAANPLGRFIDNNPTIKMLALAFILLIGAVLVLDGLEMHVPKPYIYFAMGFSVMVEWLNLLMRRRAREHHVRGAGEF